MKLEWIDGRWHLDGRGIHAGDFLEIRWPDGTWEEVRIESTNRGSVLIACFGHHDQPVSARVDESIHKLRWPQ